MTSRNIVFLSQIYIVMKRILLTLVLAFGLFSVSQAQFLSDVADMKGKTVIGGNFGLGVGGRNFSLTVAPQIGYRVRNAIELGGRLSYSLSAYFDAQYGNSSLHCFGAGPYATIQIYKGLSVHVEDEVLYCLQRFNHQTVTARDKWYNSVFVGGGYKSYFSDNTFAFILILYNLSWDYQEIHQHGSPYSSPVQIRVGYCFGL